jgi:phenylalanine-4-hydroxylase
VQARNAALIAEYGSRMNPVYIQGVRELELPAHVPRIEHLNRRLAPTGWQTVCVDGYIPSAIYAGLMARGLFPVSRVVRRLEHIEYAPEPDFVHDVLGHLPMLFSPEYRSYLQRFGAIMSRACANTLDEAFFAAVREFGALKGNPDASPTVVDAVEARMVQVTKSSVADGASELTHLRRLYVWSIEFGVMGSHEDFLIHGSALLSAPAEFRALCAAGGAYLKPFGIHVIEHENPFSELLDGYFLARDFGHLHDVLSAYQRRMEYYAGPPRVSGTRQKINEA